MSEVEDRIFHLEVLCGLQEPLRTPEPVYDGSVYGAATIYFNAFMKALSSVPPCDVCGRYHEDFGYG